MDWRFDNVEPAPKQYLNFFVGIKIFDQLNVEYKEFHTQT